MIEYQLDPNLLVALPEGSRVVSVGPAGKSEYCRTYRIEVVHEDGGTQIFFMKEGVGRIGFEATRSMFVSDGTLRRFIPEWMPEPLLVGTYASDPDTHFLLADFVDLSQDVVPKPEHYTEALAQLHLRSMGRSPLGQYGFDRSTLVGSNVTQRNAWEPSWERFWAAQMRAHFAAEEGLHGGAHDAEFARLRDIYFAKVIPRYLGPLETGGRAIQPCLLHGTLWPDNVKYRRGSKRAVIFDSAAFWGHNEVDLAVLRSEKYPMLGDAYVKAYFRRVPISEPVCDFDSRSLVYLVRNYLFMSAMYPGSRHYLIDCLRTLADRVLTEEIKGRWTPEPQQAERWTDVSKSWLGIKISLTF